MPTTSISHNLTAMLDNAHFSIRDKRSRIASYTLALSISKHVNEVRISRHMPIS